MFTSSDGNTWTVETSGTINELYDVTYNGNILVAVGANGTILTSADGSTWTQRISNKSEGIRSIAWNGSKFVAVGRNNWTRDNDPKLTSQDGITWTSSPWTKEYVFLYNVISDGNMFFAAGCSMDSSGSIYTSTDGTSWTKHSPSLGITNAIYGMAYGNNMFVAVGYYGIIFTSPDGSTWTRRVTPGTYNCYKAIINNGSKFAAVGTSGSIMTSQDGRTWIQQTLPAGWNLRDIAWNGNRFVAVGDSCVITSVDGETWTAIKNGEYTTVTWDGSRFIAIGEYGEVISLNDEITWSKISSIPSDYSVRDVVYDGSKYVAVGMYYSMAGKKGTVLT